MFSKKKLSMAFVLIIAFSLNTLTSCAPKVGEVPPETPPQSLEGTKCLSNLKPVVVKFVQAKATDGEVSQFWDCATTSIKMFKRYVYGRADDRFTSEELVGFVEQNFLNEDKDGPKISNELRHQFMLFKQLFIGGTVDDLTRDELDQIVRMFDDLKRISVRINPYMSVISQKWTEAQKRNSPADSQFFEKASDEIQLAAADLAAMIVKNNSSYRLDDFVTFMKEYGLFYGEGWTAPQQIGRYMPIVKKVKRGISGGNQDVIATAEWKSFILLGTRGYIQYLRYFYFIQSSANTGSGRRLNYLARTIEDMLGAFQDLLQVKPTDPLCGLIPDKSVQSRAVSCISKAELSEILAAFSDAWADFKVSPILIDEVMKLKKVYFGGNDQSISSLDFARGKNKIPLLRSSVEKFMAYFSVYTLDWDRANYDYAQAQQIFSEAHANLLASAKDLGGLFEEPYNVDNIVLLLKEIDRLYPSADPKSGWIKQFGKYLPLMRDSKNILFSEKDSLIKRDQWAPLLSFGARFYSTYMYYTYFLEKESFGSSEFLDSFKRVADQILDISKDILSFKKSQSLSAAEIQLLASRLSDLDILPVELSSSSIDQLVKLILNRIFWPAELRIKGSSPNALNLTSIAYVREELAIWYETERFANSISVNPLNHAELQGAIAKTLKNAKLSNGLRTGLGELALLVAGPVSQSVEANHQLLISNIARHVYGPISLSQMNMKRAIGRLIVRMSITSKSRLDSYEGVKLEELNSVYKAIHPILVQIGFIEKDNLAFAENRFRDANLFTAHGNGNDTASFQELGDLVGQMMSGLKINSLMKKDVVDRCLSRHAKVDLYTTVSEKCLREVYNDRVDNYFRSSPEFLKFFSASSREDFSEYFGNLMKAAGHFPNAAGTVRLSDADMFPHAIQYLEMMIARFDLDRNGILNVDEAKSAFPSFRGILVELTKDQSLIKEKDLLALFTYIMHYGRPPEGVKDYLLKYIPWKRNPESWTVSADRLQFAGILGFIADSAEKAQAKKVLLSREDEAVIRKDPSFFDGE